MTRSQFVRLALDSFLVALWLLVATFIALMLPAPWEGMGGRDFRPKGATLALILLFSGAAFRYAFRWAWTSLILGLAAVELVALLLIGELSGATGSQLFIDFNLQWLAFINLFIGLPWLAGAGIGEALLRSRGDRK